MNDYIDKLALLFEAFPGIGKRQARRFVYFLLHKDTNYIQDILSLIKQVKEEITQCSECYRFFAQNTNPQCSVCTANNQSKQLLIVEKDADFESLHKTHIYQGKYFILGGHINPNEKKRSYARVDTLIERIKRDISRGTIMELIFGLSINPEAEHTRIQLYTILRNRFPHLVFSTLGRGLSSGTELEYSDTETLKHAFKSRIIENKNI